MSVSFKELPGSPKETYDYNGMTAERQLICAWSDRNAFVQEILGPDYQLGITNPVAYPGASSVFATKVQVEPLTDDMVIQTLSSLTSGLNTYQGFAKVIVKYVRS